MATFAAVNSGLSSPPPSTSSMTPNMSQPPASSAPERMSTTPPPEEKQPQSYHAPAASSRTDRDAIESSPNTPTRHSFAGMLGQRPLPSEPLSADCAGEPIDTRSETSSNPNSQGHRAGSQAVSTPGKTPILDSGGDVEMGEGDEDEDEASENESVTSESQRPSKKKKGQRFFCTDYPPCQLSFTRSEHLARHIRKHTGERPFQCHCSRRFSRLDNLRQHAQTVHVNEDIPGDSLAATSTRFQRQIRTDRVRPASSRSRASTMGSQGGHSRGHSRNLSASSIASTVSNMSISEDVRRRPQPLAMAGDGANRVRLSLETYGGPPPPTYGYYNNQSPTGYSTPTSTTYQNGNVTSHYQPGVTSPSSTINRSSVYDPPRGHTRRLSQPSTSDPYQQPQGPSYPPPYYSPSSNAAFSPQSSAYASPTSSVFSHSRRESESEMDYRRRTWHPSTSSQYAQRPATSGLTYHQTPDQARPAFSQQPAASQLTRLPGIESFDHVPPPTARQHPSPLPSHEVPRPTSSGRTIDGLHHGLTRLDITTANGPPPEASAVPSYHAPPPPGYLQVPSHQQQHAGPPPASSHYVSHSRNMSMPEGPITPRRNKRNAWYGGPVTPSSASSHGPPAPPPFVFPARPSPEDSGSSEGVQTPSLSHAVEHHPVIYNPSSHHHGHRHHNSTSSIGAPGSTLLPPPPFEEKRSYYPSSPQKPDQPVRADSGFQPYPPQLTSQQPQPHHQPAPQQPAQQASQQFPPQTYALQTGHDPSFAQANHGAGGVGHKPSDSARLDVLVTAALSSSNGTRATSHPS